jgi:hypothetical protein
MKFCIKWASMYMVIRNEVKVILFRFSAPRIFDQDCSIVHNSTYMETYCLVLGIFCRRVKPDAD